MDRVLVNSAIKYNDGRTEVGRRHSDIIALMAKLGVYTNSSTSVQGFVDNTGKFYTRIEARNLAVKNGQLPPDFEGEAYSEDLWPGPIVEIEE